MANLKVFLDHSVWDTSADPRIAALPELRGAWCQPLAVLAGQRDAMAFVALKQGM